MERGLQVDTEGNRGVNCHRCGRWYLGTHKDTCPHCCFNEDDFIEEEANDTARMDEEARPEALV